MNKLKCIKTDVWKLYFDGAFSKDGAGVCIVLICPDRENISKYFKFEFDVTNNVAKYEDLFLGLKLAKNLKVQNISVFDDS